MKQVGMLLLTICWVITLRAEESHRALVANNPSGCVSTSLTYGHSSTGSLGLADCTFSDGTYYDRYTFSGSAGDLIVISHRPLSATLTNPRIVLAPPVGDGSTPPEIFGQTAAELTYKLSSSGTWAFAVGTNDVFGTGSYFVKLTKYLDDDPTGPQSCVLQYLQCHQTGLWFLGAQSCRFKSDTTRAFEDFSFYGIAGDVVTITMGSSDFGPQANIYSDVKDAYLGAATFPDAVTSTQVLQLPDTGYYEIVTTSRVTGKAGFFYIKLDCTGSACVPPLFVNQPASASLAFGGRASLSASANGSAPVTINWANPFTGQSLGTGPSILTSPLFEQTIVQASAHNVCGDELSDTATINVFASHRRAVRH